MTVEPPGPQRCPTCGATTRDGDPWCTLCYTDLRPPQVAAPAPAERGPLPPDPLTAPLAAVTGEPEAAAGPSWPCSACGTVNPMALDTCAGCGQHFLAELRGQQSPRLELPMVGDIMRLGRGQRFALAGAVVLAFVVLTLVLGLLFG